MRTVDVLLAVLGLLLIAGCQRPREQHIVISDATSEELLSIGKSSGQGPITGLRLRVQGALEGNAQLVLLQRDRPHHLETLSGAVDITWQGDWSADRARLHYVPGLVSGGRLEITYSFLE